MAQARRILKTQAQREAEAQRSSHSVEQPLRLIQSLPAMRLKPSVVGLVVGVVASVIVLAQLGLSVLQVADAYRISDLRVQNRELKRVERVLQQGIDALSSPQNLAQSAIGLGMVQNVHPSYIRLSDRAILGTQDPALSAVAANTVPNAALSQITYVDPKAADLQPVTQQSAANGAAATLWTGDLPAPDTR